MRQIRAGASKLEGEGQKLGTKIRIPQVKVIWSTTGAMGVMKLLDKLLWLCDYRLLSLQLVLECTMHPPNVPMNFFPVISRLSFFFKALYSNVAINWSSRKKSNDKIEIA